MKKKAVDFAQTPRGKDAGLRKFEVLQDGLSPVLEVIRLKGDCFYEAQFSPPFCVSYADHKRCFHIIEHGEVTVTLKEQSELLLVRGDLILFPHGIEHSISHVGVRFEAPKLSAASLRKQNIKQSDGHFSSARWSTGTFDVDPVLSKGIFAALPQYLIVRGVNRRPSNWVDKISEMLLTEAKNLEPGSQVMISRLLDLVVINCLREWAKSADAKKGWLVASVDPRIGKAIAAIHSKPSRGWTVVELAGIASMSRSAFAAKFQTLVGESPASYMTRWRLNRAAEMLVSSKLSVAEIAKRSAYISPAAFSRAFSLNFSESPQKWRKKYQHIRLIAQAAD